MACKNAAIRIKPVVRVCWGGQEPAERDNSTQALNSRGGIIADRLVYISLIAYATSKVPPITRSEIVSAFFPNSN